jgi:hypothetical protein
VIACTHTHATSMDLTCVLLPPCVQDPVPQQLLEKIMACLAARFDLLVKYIQPHLQAASI